MAVLAFVALVMVGGTSTAEAPLEPVITYVEAHLDRRTLSIDGHNLGRTPVVTMSRQALALVDVTPQGITVALPAGFRPRTYLLTVRTSAGISRSLLFNLTVAAHPARPPGRAKS